MAQSKNRMAFFFSRLIVAVAVLVLAAPQARAEPAAQGTTTASPDIKRWQVVAPGRVEPQSGEIRIAPTVMGLVDEVLVKVNDTVFAGEPLIRLTDTELRARLAGAEAQVILRKRVRDEAPATGPAGERRKIEDAVSDAEQAVLDARSAVDRAAANRRHGGEPDSSLTAARAALLRAQDDLKKREAEVRRIDQRGALPTQVEGQLRLARSELNVARAALQNLTIRAPIDGTVLQVNIRVGELATPSTLQPVLLLADLSALRVRAELDERDLSEIKVGQPVPVRAEAFPGREFEGRVSSIAPMVEPGRLDAGGLRNRSDVDVAEVMVDLVRPSPLAVGMKTAVYFHADKSSTAKR